MPDLTISLTDQQLTRLQDAFTARVRADQQLTPAETRAELINVIRDIVRASEREAAIAAARDGVAEF